ncbi:PilZ domain-containing protein [Pseudomonas mangiferae]|uniref:PilZ domain-containing protein n=2 Tax=Pseudomonas mangiferae TaxID=2593654 RepID=A0A553H1H9_9PSED|nr:PilZ domain-containing protein [Pseudomonas mangiferae]TRX75608.1 PilZ domain-containing protein [Pseudomonas mangiferae]
MPDATVLDVSTIGGEDGTVLVRLAEVLAEARALPWETALQRCLGLLRRLNRSELTLLERQRALQSFSEAFRFYGNDHPGVGAPPPAFLPFCEDLARGFKRLLLQILDSGRASRPHLAWCLYMAEHFVVQALLRHYQRYQEPPASLWRDAHRLYALADHHGCLDEPIAAAFSPTPADSVRGLYQQILLFALSSPFHLTECEGPRLFGALAPLAHLARLLPWDEEDDSEGILVDLDQDRPWLTAEQAMPTDLEQPGDGAPRPSLFRFEPGALLIALDEPAPLQSEAEHALLERVRSHWSGRHQRRHPRADHGAECALVVGLTGIHARLQGEAIAPSQVRMLDTSSGGARLLCPAALGETVPVGQLALLLSASGTPTLALVRWRHVNALGLHLGLRYLKGLPRPVWVRRVPSAQPHPAVLQSTPAPGAGWHHGLWLLKNQFVEGESLWLQLASVGNQATLVLPRANLDTLQVARYPLRLA